MAEVNCVFPKHPDFISEPAFLPCRGTQPVSLIRTEISVCSMKVGPSHLGCEMTGCPLHSSPHVPLLSRGSTSRARNV